MNTKQVGVRVLLEGGHFIQIITTEADATRIVRSVESRTVQQIGGTCLSTGSIWTAAVARIVGVHTFVPQIVGGVEPQAAYAGQRLSGPH